MTRACLFLLAATSVLRAQSEPAEDKPTQGSGGATSSTAPLPPAPPVDEGMVSHQGYTPGRYETLWTRSPFSVETPEAAAESPDYSLVGVAEVDGITYASLIEKQNSEHFIISSDEEARGLKLTSIKRGKGDGDDTIATINRSGEILSLKLEAAAAGAPTTLPTFGAGVVNPMPGSLTPQVSTPMIPMPGSVNVTPTRPLIRIHRPPIHVPPRPTQAAPPPEPTTPAPPDPNAAPPPPISQ